MTKEVLGNLGLRIKKHWREFRPKMYRGLKRSGKLDEIILHEEERALNMLEKLEKQGLNPDQAWEIVREEIFLPSEDDQPELRGPFTWEKED